MSTGMPPQPEEQGSAGGPQSPLGAGQWIVFFSMIVFFIMIGIVWIIAVAPSGIVATLAVLIAVPGTIANFFQSDYFKDPAEQAFGIIGRKIEIALDNKNMTSFLRPAGTTDARQPIPEQQQIAARPPIPSQPPVAPRQKRSGARKSWTPIRLQMAWRKVWATVSIVIVVILLFQLVPAIPRLIPQFPRFCAGIFNGPTISYQLPTQEPVGISGDASCFDFEQQNNDQSDDVEQLIYAENKQAIPDTSLPHITEIVVVSLTGSDISSTSEGKVVLRGALIAQKEYNQTAPSKHLPPLRLLVANDGTNARYASTLAKQIVQLAKSDPTILGVVGWPFSTLTTQDALTTLEQAHISSISPTLSSNEFTGAYSYFFRIAPPDIQQGTDGARFAKAQWNPHKVAIFVDYGNPYSRSLAMSFAAALEVSSTKIYFVQYTRDESNGVVPELVQKALGYGPDLVYFAGYANDFDPIRGNLLALRPAMPIMGGDGLYELGGYQQNDSNFQNVYFTTFATTYTSTDQQGRKIQQPQPFSTEYSRTFDRLQEYPTAIDYSIAESDSILAYDVTKALLTAHFRANRKLEQREAIHQALQMMNDDGGNAGNAQGAIQGASGRISFGLDGNPEEKVIYMQHVDASHNVCIAAVYGTYQEGVTGQPGPKPDCAVNAI